MIFNDKGLLFRTMYNLGLNPENKVWAEHQNQFQKAPSE